MNQPQRPTPQQIESEIRARLREKWIHPDERRRLRRVLVLQRGVKRHREEQARRLSTEQLLNNWAACPPEHPDKLVDLSSVADHQLLQAVIQQDIGRAEDKAMLADSAIAELAKRANNLRMTVANYVRLRTQIAEHTTS